MLTCHDEPSSVIIYIEDICTQLTSCHIQLGPQIPAVDGIEDAKVDVDSPQARPLHAKRADPPVIC